MIINIAQRRSPAVRRHHHPTRVQIFRIVQLHHEFQCVAGYTLIFGLVRLRCGGVVHYLNSEVLLIPPQRLSELIPDSISFQSQIHGPAHDYMISRLSPSFWCGSTAPSSSTFWLTSERLGPWHHPEKNIDPYLYVASQILP
jgi:hypothetical protein